MLEFLNDKKIAILGGGVNNLKLIEYLSKHGYAPKVLIWQNPDELIGKLDEFDVVFRTPGYPYLSPAIQQAKSKGVVIHSQTKLFFELCPCPIIGVTGTKGKGTTSSMIAKILADAGKRVFLGGNIGKDPFEFIESLSPSDFVVLELSSFQLQDLTTSPHIAVVLNVTQDHLDHHKSVDEYVEAKKSILKFQHPADFAVLSDLLPPDFAKLGEGKKIFFSQADGAGYQTKLLGAHNKFNIAAAAKTAGILGISGDIIAKSVAGFQGLPHRLELVGQKDGISYINDSFSTNIDTTIAAINSFSSPLILILGGYDKGLDYAPLGRAILQSRHIKGLVVVGDVAGKILKETQGFTGKIKTSAKDMKQIISDARSLAASGDTILLSPAAASFGMFKDYKQRGEQFAQLAKQS